MPCGWGIFGGYRGPFDRMWNINTAAGGRGRIGGLAAGREQERERERGEETLKSGERTHCFLVSANARLSNGEAHGSQGPV